MANTALIYNLNKRAKRSKHNHKAKHNEDQAYGERKMRAAFKQRKQQQSNNYNGESI